jgi:hypothetical protein
MAPDTDLFTLFVIFFGCVFVLAILAFVKDPPDER